MHVSQVVSPTLHVSRALGMLPFTRLGHSPPSFSSSRAARAATLVLHLVHVTSYVYHIVKTLAKLLETAKQKSIEDSSSLAVLVIAQMFDILNVVHLGFLSQCTCGIIQDTLYHMFVADQILKVKNKRNFNLHRYILFTVMGLMCKNVSTWYIVDKMQVTTRLVPSFGVLLLLAAEQLFFVMCLELRRRLRILNTQIYDCTFEISHRVVSKFADAFEALCRAQERLNRGFGLFLLLNLSQILLFSLSQAVNVIFACVLSKHIYLGGKGTCSLETASSFITAKVLLLGRFLALIWGCHIVTKEVSLTYFDHPYIFQNKHTYCPRMN